MSRAPALPFCVVNGHACISLFALNILISHVSFTGAYICGGHNWSNFLSSIATSSAQGFGKGASCSVIPAMLCENKQHRMRALPEVGDLAANPDDEQAGYPKPNFLPKWHGHWRAQGLGVRAQSRE